MLNIYTDKLLQISTEGLYSSYEGKDFNDELNKILKRKNGFYAFEAALHFFSSDEIMQISNLMKEVYRYKNTENCIFFAEDIFGNLFCYNNYRNKIFLLDLENGSIEECGSSFKEWSKNILEDYNYLTGYSIAHDWQKRNGSLREKERLFPKTPFVLGGEYSVSNLDKIEQLEGIKNKFNLYNQIKDIKDGEKVIY